MNNYCNSRLNYGILKSKDKNINEIIKKKKSINVLYTTWSQTSTSM